LSKQKKIQKEDKEYYKTNKFENKYLFLKQKDYLCTRFNQYQTNYGRLSRGKYKLVGAGRRRLYISLTVLCLKTFCQVED